MVNGWISRIAGLLAGLLAGAAQAGAPLPAVTLTPQDRVLVLAPHPDDEVLACGGIIQQAMALKVPVRVVILTHGDNNQWSFSLYRKHPVFMPRSVRLMGEVRHDEAEHAAAILGYSSADIRFLGYPDFGTFAIWEEHWDDTKPVRGMLTRARAVPYSDAVRPGAPYKGEEIVRDLTTELREFRPTKIFVSHPSDYNSDHRALYLFARIALWDVEKELTPELFPYLTHFPRWPLPRTYTPTAALEPPARLLDDQLQWRTFPLTPTQIQTKDTALQAHQTQYVSSARYLKLFIRANELFGDYPAVTLAPATARALQTTAAGVPSEQLLDTERVAFIGVVQRFVQLDGDQLVFTVRLSRPLAEGTEASLYVFGYRPDRPFAEMPKLHVRIGEVGFATHDQNDKLPAKTVTVTRNLNELTIRVSLAALGNPDRVLTAERTFLGEVPLDWAAWRVVLLPH